MHLYMITELSNSKEKIFYILLPQGSSIFLIMPHRLMSSEKNYSVENYSAEGLISCNISIGKQLP